MIEEKGEKTLFEGIGKQKSLEYSLIVEDKIQTQLNYEQISEVYSKLKKYEDAYKYYKLKLLTM